MAEVKRNNTFRIVGYLKENNLVEEVGYDGSKVINGNVTVVTKDGNAFKISFKKKEGTKGYDESLSLLPGNTISVSSYLKDSNTATFATALEMSTKIWAIGVMEEYCYKKNDKEASMMILKALSMGISFGDSSKAFIPSATFTADVFLAEINDEVKDGVNTGRLNITGLIPGYQGIMHKISFVAPVEDNVASYIKKNYKVKDTVTLKGDLTNMTVKVQSDSADDNFFGRGDGTSYTTTFVKEQIIRGGSKYPLHADDDGAITVEEAKAGLAVRSKKMEEAGKRVRVKPAAPSATPKPAVKPAVEDNNGFDF